MDLSDEDIFVSDGEDEPLVVPAPRNPVEEHLTKEMRVITERVEREKRNIEQVKEMTDNILKKMHTRQTCGESSGSENESNMYQVTGEPLLKKKRMRRKVLYPTLEVKEVWQQVIDDKWIAGFHIENTSNSILQDPCFYAVVKGQSEIRGIYSFWEKVDSLWNRADQLQGNVEKLMATVVLDLPNFEDSAVYEAYGMISYVLDNKNMEAPVPIFRLRHTDVISRSFAPKYSVNAENTILAIKSVSVDRDIIFPLDKASFGTHLFEFIEENDFKYIDEDMSDVFICRDNEYLRHCIIEILPCTEGHASIRLTARSLSHLEVIVCLLRQKLPDINASEVSLRLTQAAKALENELQMELEGSVEAIDMARAMTDLLIS